MTEDWAKQAESREYINASRATELIESPAIGFVKPSELKTTFDFQRALIKQNNLLISLAVTLSAQIKRLEEQVASIKKDIPTTAPTKELEGSIDELTKRIGGLNLGTDQPVPRKKGQILVFKKPSDILRQEKEK